MSDLAAVLLGLAVLALIAVAAIMLLHGQGRESPCPPGQHYQIIWVKPVMGTCKP